MKVLYVADTVVESGGAAREHIGGICRVMQKHGHRVTLVCQTVDGGLDGLGVEDAVQLGTGQSLRRARCLLSVVNAILGSHKVDVVYMRYRPAQMVLSLLPRFRPIDRFLELNGIPRMEMRTCWPKRLLVRIAESAFEGSFFRSSRGVVGVTKQIADHYRQLHGLEGSRVVVLGNGVRIERFTPRQHEQENGPVRLGFVGSLQWWQGLHTSIEAAAHPDVQAGLQLQIVGHGPELGSLRRLASEIGASNVSFSGPVPAERIPAILQGFDIGLVSKSIRGEELSPLKLFEYWAAGLPVLAADLPGLDLVRRVNGGLLYEPGCVSSLVRGLRQMMASREQWPAWGANGRRYVEQFASWDRIGDQTMAFIYARMSKDHSRTR